MRLGFQQKIVSFFIGLVTLVLLVVFVAVFLATRQNAAHRAEDDLQVGARVFQRLLVNRNDQLLQSVSVLAQDFGFKEAVATGDRPTIRSVLLNHGARVNADMGMLVSMQGEIITGTLVDDIPVTVFPMPELLERARHAGMAAGIGTIGGEVYQLVIVPVFAPLQIGWVCMGFSMDDALARDIAALTGLEVSFLRRDGDRIRLFASTLQGGARVSLERAADRLLPAGQGVRTLELAGEPHLSVTEAIARDSGEAGPVAVLQSSLQVALASYHSLFLELLALAGFALFAALLLALAVAGGVTRPVRTLAAAAERIAAGNYRDAVPVSGRDELGLLAETFNRMQREIAEREERIIHQAYHDALTGLPNRALAAESLEQALARARRRDGKLAVLMLDLDRFKEVNDVLGHHTGDRVLKEVAQRLRAAVRESDLVARLGGDEFLLILEDSDQGRAATVARKLHAALVEPVEAGESRVTVDLSAGLALYPEHGAEAELLLRRADIAMYDAKQSGASLAVYEMGRDELHLYRLSLLHELREAIELGQFLIHYQPKRSLRDGRVAHVEALVRWRHPRHGIMPPDEFIQLAEQSGHIGLVTAWVLEQAIRQCAAWRARGEEIVVSVNLSALDLMDESLPTRVAELLAEHGLPGVGLVLEVTESAVLRDAGRGVRMLERLREVGIRLSIDDFGTGQSSLAQLKRLPVDELKIDKSFVINIREGSDDDVIVRSTIELAHNMGLTVVAEGVETREGWELLKRYGCDLAQGYYISRPLEAEDFMQWHAAQAQA